MPQRIPAEDKRKWKLQQTLNELQKWATYLQTSAETFLDEFTKYSSSSTSETQKKKNDAIRENVNTLKKESASLRAKIRRFR
jgi:uncharacterized protein YlxW (UPF0749 family)